MDILDVANELNMDEQEVRGVEHMFVCTVHDDTNPSLQINSEDQVWYCFGCVRGGGIQEFIRAYAGDRSGEFVLGPRIGTPAIDQGTRARAERLFSSSYDRARQMQDPDATELDRAAIEERDIDVISICTTFAVP